MLHITSLHRSVVPWGLAVSWAWFASTVVFVGAWSSHGFGSGVRGSVAVFLAWAITRELAPRRALASAAAPFAGIAFAMPADTDLLACFGVLLVARIAARSVGDPPTRLDLALLVGFSAWCATRQAGLPVALVLAAIVASDSPPRRARVAGVAALIAALVVGSVEGTLTARPDWGDPSVPKQVLLAITAAGAALLLLVPLPSTLRARDDRTRGQLRGTRIRSARVAVLACIIAAIGWNGLEGAFALSSASAAVLAAGSFGAGARAAARPDGHDTHSRARAPA